MRVPDGLTSSSGLMVLRMHSDTDHSHTLPYFSAKYVSYSETAGGSKSQFTPSKSGSESEKDQRTSKSTSNTTEGLFTKSEIESEKGAYFCITSSELDFISKIVTKLISKVSPHSLLLSVNRFKFCYFTSAIPT